jgi:hypothetical protein
MCVLDPPARHRRGQHLAESGIREDAERLGRGIF